MKPPTKRCPQCKEKIHAEAIKCKHCGSILTKATVNVVYDNVTLIKRTLANRFSIQEPIGEGGMAIVFKAIQKNLGRSVALKVLKPDLIYDQEFLNRFHREAKVAAKLQRPNIITIYDVCHNEQYYSYGQGIENNTHFISMELLDGMDLSTRIRLYGHLSVDDLVPIIIQITDALEYAHRKNVVHRDVKSPNIFLHNDGRAILMDFGIAHDAAATQLTIKGESSFTPEFASPEQVAGREIDARTDIFSLGVVMYQALTGISPFKGTNYMATINKIVNEIPVPIGRIIKVPEWIEDTIAVCLIKDRTKRIQSVGQLKEILLNRKKIPRKILQPIQDTHQTIKYTKEQPEIPQGKVEYHQAEKISNKTPSKFRTRKTSDRGSTITIVLSASALIIFIAIIVLITQSKNTQVEKRQYNPSKQENNNQQKLVPVTPGNDTQLTNTQTVTQNNLQNESTQTNTESNNKNTQKQQTVSGVEVPDVIDLSPDEAASKIKGAGLRVYILKVFAGADKSQQVIKQNPRGGVRVEKGATITLTVGE